MGSVVIFEQDADEFEGMSVAEMIEWLEDIRDDQPEGAPDLFFEVEQTGDCWDGYSVGTVRISRDETPEEEAEREKREADEYAAYLRRMADEREKNELALLSQLVAKYCVNVRV